MRTFPVKPSVLNTGKDEVMPSGLSNVKTIELSVATPGVPFGGVTEEITGGDCAKVFIVAKSRTRSGKKLNRGPLDH